VDTSYTEGDEDSMFEIDPRTGIHIFTAKEDYLHRSITSCAALVGGIYLERLREPQKPCPLKENHMTQRTGDSLRLRLQTRSTNAKSRSTEHNRSRTNRTYMALRRRVHYKRRSNCAKLLYVQKPFPVTKGGRRSVVGIVIRLWACRSEVRMPVGERALSLLHYIHTGSEAHPASYSVGTRILYRG
jgi:hypothetical protein